MAGLSTVEENKDESAAHLQENSWPHGTLNFWPTIQEGQLVELDIEPHVNRPVDSVTACILMLNIINLLTAEYIAENQVRVKGVLKRLCQPGGVEE